MIIKQVSICQVPTIYQALLNTLLTYVVLFNPCKKSVIPIVQMRKLGLREVKSLTKSHRARR